MRRPESSIVLLMLVMAIILGVGVFLMITILLDWPNSGLVLPMPTVNIVKSTEESTLLIVSPTPSQTPIILNTPEAGATPSLDYLATIDAQSIVEVNLETTIESQRIDIEDLKNRAELEGTIVAVALDAQKQAELSQGINWAVLTPAMAVIVSIISSIGTLYFTKRKDDREQEKHSREKTNWK